MISAHHLFEEADHDVWVDERRVVSDEGFGDVGHDAGVVPGESFSSVHFYTETSPRPLRGKTLWNQKVPDDEGNTSAKILQRVFTAAVKKQLCPLK